MSYPSSFAPFSDSQYYYQGAHSHTASVNSHPGPHAGAYLALDSAELSNNYLAAGPITLSADYADTYQTASSALDPVITFADEQFGYASTVYAQEPSALLLADDKDKDDSTSPSYTYSNVEHVPAYPVSSIPNSDTSNNAALGSPYSTLSGALGFQTPMSQDGSMPLTPPSTLTSPAPTPSHIETITSDFGSEPATSPASSAYATPFTPPPTLDLASALSLLLSTQPPKTTPRRNTRVATARAHPVPGPSSALFAADRWTCPHCGYIQANRRKPDLRRHIATHTTTAEDWVCCGVPLFDAELTKELPPAALQKDPVIYNGQLMVGGCNKSFSRPDALKRHLHANQGRCFGSEKAPYLVGNQVGER
ncbi:hypothetical protein GY45DRAFT_883801 [Cubamyces sp. BRFM 1775]|nr:hypothetical protein GY45DRAFT_883801 [Cubamyces sp. BRFM 1775]